MSNFILWIVVVPVALMVAVGVLAHWCCKKHNPRVRLSAGSLLSYRRNVWSPGEECSVVEYGGPTGSRYLAGAEKQAALHLIQEDINAVSAGASYSVSTINADQKWYWYTIQPTRRSSWEVKLDENGNEIPYPCPDRPGPADPRNFAFNLSNVTVSGVYSQAGDGTQLAIILKGNLPRA